MAAIQGVVVNPLDKIKIQMTIDAEAEGATLFYQLSNDTESLVSFGSIIVDEQFVLNYSTNRQYMLEFVMKQLNLIPNTI